MSLTDESIEVEAMTALGQARPIRKFMDGLGLTHEAKVKVLVLLLFETQYKGLPKRPDGVGLDSFDELLTEAIGEVYRGSHEPPRELDFILTGHLIDRLFCDYSG